MSDDPETANTPAQHTAHDLAATLGGFEESILVDDQARKLLTPVQDALISDAFGLLNGIAFGAITASQPRIRDNLIRVIEQLPPSSDNDVAAKLTTLLATVISKAAGAGLTASDQSLATRQRGRSL